MKLYEKIGDEKQHCKPANKLQPSDIIITGNYKAPHTGNAD